MPYKDDNKRILYNAKARNIEVLITPKEILELMEEHGNRCKLTGEIVTFPRTSQELRNKKTNASLDRIDNNLDYTKENCQIITKDMNRMKWNLTNEELKYWSRLVYNNLKDKYDFQPTFS